jgi:hypothetical protein
VTIDCEDAETIAGALLDAFGELPATGASIVLCGMKLTVDSVEFNRISRVLVEPPAVESTADAGDSTEVGAAVETDATSGGESGDQAAATDAKSAPVEPPKKAEGV